MPRPAERWHQSLTAFSENRTNKPKKPKMKSFIVLALFVAAAAAAPPTSNDRDAQIVRFDADNIGVDGYNFGYETSNGISAQEEGKLQNAGTDNEAISVRGQFSYTGADGVVYTVTYVADENGFQPQGAHLPVAP